MTKQLTIPGSVRPRKLPTLDSSLGQWFTPPHLAARIARWARLRPHYRTLEPTAGSGALVAPLLGAGCKVDACELDPRWAEHLRATQPGAKVFEGDYLARRAPKSAYDLALMNPPYEDNGEATFTLKALEESERVIAIMRSNALHGKERFDLLWKHFKRGRFGFGRKVKFITRPRFHASGGKHEIVILEMGRVFAGCGSPPPEWWRA